ncbi:ANTAR domain-containing response regulator [Evansella clarkii]|uniref:ANTAR domain-containing response regulator n=1 Tax=Evansella clarkii TaxID=79879 RepID=UPI000B44AB2A|nr:response regulator [Evansella clarkii]
MRRILLVEDESIVRMDIALILEEQGYIISGEAGDGEEGVEMAFKLEPDLIIMDIKMPKLNGLKASKIISQKLSVPILLLTAYSQQQYIDKAKESNIVGYLVKPVAEGQLIPAVEIALHQAEVSSRYKQEIKEADERLQKRKIVEKAKGILMERFGYSEDVSFNKMRKLSMDKQISIDMVAKHILKKYSSRTLEKTSK